MKIISPELITLLGFCLAGLGYITKFTLIPAVHSFVDKKIDNKLIIFTTANCENRHKEVNEVKEDIKDLKKSVSSMALSLASIETAISIYFNLPQKKEKGEI